ncbi:MAG: DNA-directed RNA polymerase subunit alpha, partial [Parcubacteria group bacterium]
LEIGEMMIDAMFSPVTKVGYKVEPTRVGDITNYDKLTMDIETDGTITPQQAVEEAGKILINHFELLKNQE